MNRRLLLGTVSIFATSILLNNSYAAEKKVQNSVNYALYNGHNDVCDQSIVNTLEGDKFFNTIFTKLISIEGGYRKCSGTGEKEVNFGITKKYYPNEDIKNLKLERAKYIYYRDYYNKRGIKNIPDRLILSAVFFNAVNQGPNTSVSQLQKIIGTKPDGFFGPISAKSFINKKSKVGVDKILNDFCTIINERYNKLISVNSDLICFKKGWEHRVNSYNQ